MTSSERMAELGELCTCGRQAVTVFITEQREVGYCGLPDGGDQTGACPFCGASERHRQLWGDPLPCPAYRLRPFPLPVGSPEWITAVAAELREFLGDDLAEWQRFCDEWLRQCIAHQDGIDADSEANNAT